MKRLKWVFQSLLTGLLVAGCVTTTGQQTAEPTPQASVETPGMTTSPTRFVPNEAGQQAAIGTPTPKKMWSMPIADETILTIRNDQPYSGRAGEPKPDWLGWGAQAFSVAPNGDFWILDSAAHSQRLLHLAPPYDKPQIISLEYLVMGVADVDVAHDFIWVLDVASQPSRVVALAPDGKTLASYDLPQGLWLENGLTGISLAQDGTLLVELDGGASLYRLFDQNGQVDPQRVEGYSYGNRLFRIEAKPFAKTGTIYAGDITVEVSVEQVLGGLRVLGAAPDGSFYVEVYEMSEGSEVSVKREIRRYSAAGDLLGTAHPLPSAVYASRDLVVGPGGLVYQLVSNPDHSVQIVRLGFQPVGASQVEPSPAPTHTPTPLTPLLSTWTVTPAEASDMDRARETLLAFFTLLRDGRYAEAVPLYGGPYDVMRDNNPDTPEDDYEALWQAVCTRQTLCLFVARIVEQKTVAQDEFKFVVEFIWRDGTLFKLGPCCGATEAEAPPVWQFPYTVKKVNGAFEVMEGPVYVP